MKKILVWETLHIISGGQKMTLIITDMLKDEFDFTYLIPSKGALSDELDKRGISYVFSGALTLPLGVKKKTDVLKYAWLSLKAVTMFIKLARREKPDIIYVPGPAALPWGAICGALIRKPVIWHLHHIFIDGATKRLLNICSGWKSVKAIISVSNCVGEQIINKKAWGKKITLYNPVDIIKYTSGNAESIIKELNLMQ